jgi:[ribosomal protein S5]-alanine N-acetyltransferase
MIEPIITSRLVIRELTENDFTHIRLYAQDMDAYRFMLLWLETDEKIRAFIDNALSQAASETRREYLLSVETIDGKEFIGNCCIEVDPVSGSTAEIGYWLVRSCWKNGYAAEISRALVHYGFTHLGFHRIYAKCDELNTASASVLEKIGMRYEGTLREHIWLRDHWRSSRYYGILKDEFDETI